MRFSNCCGSLLPLKLLNKQCEHFITTVTLTITTPRVSQRVSQKVYKNIFVLWEFFRLGFIFTCYSNNESSHRPIEWCKVTVIIRNKALGKMWFLMPFAYLNIIICVARGKIMFFLHWSRSIFAQVCMYVIEDVVHFEICDDL